jgi:hypothetical protein
MRYVLEKSFRESQNTHIIFLYEIMWNNIVEPDMPQMKIWRMRIESWIPKSTNTHSAYVPMQKWLHKCVAILRYTHIGCLVIT